MRHIGRLVARRFALVLLASVLAALGLSVPGGIATGPGPYSVDARALLGGTGTDVTIQVSGPDLPAVLDKIHVKTWSPETEGAQSWNFTDVPAPGGIATVHVAPLTRGDPVDVLVHVKHGPEYNVTTTTTVLRGPDLTLTQIAVPTDVTRIHPFDVEVTVAERGEDTGATAQVDLYDGDGTTSLATADVTVTPGGSAVVTLHPVLPTPDEHTLRAVVSHSMPSEWGVAPDEATQRLYVNYYTSNGVVATDHPLATQIGVDVLKAGGNAIDAAAAVTFALNVTQPQLVGIGGGSNVLVHLKTGETFAIDGRETAPVATTPTTYEGRKVADIRPNGYSVGVPGTLATVDYMLSHWGTTTLAQALEPAIGLAENGFPVGSFLHDLTIPTGDPTVFQPETRAVFLTPTGGQLPLGYLLKQPDLARTFRLLQTEGTAAFYDGEIAQAIIDVQHRAAVSGREGLMTSADLANYRVDVEPALSLPGGYRGYTVLGSPPATNGGDVVLETLGLIREFLADPRNAGYAWGYGTANSLHVFLEAMRLAFADRDMWLGDPRYTNVPAQQLLNRNYLAERSTKIDGQHTMCSPVSPGNPFAFADQPAPVTLDVDDAGGGHTSHYTIIDKWGNVVVMTSTLADSFGSGIMVPGYGFMLDDSLTLFNATPKANPATGNPGANDAAGGKRPMGSMAPTLILKDGEPLLGTGSYSGPFIPSVVLNVVLNVLEYDMPIQDAVYAPRLWSSVANGDAAVNPGFQALIQPLRDMGHIAPTFGGCAGNVAKVPTGGSAIGSTGSFEVDLGTFDLAGAQDNVRFPDAKTVVVTRP
jgi:gamma-glutamyltranspeptidase / glutathione hydrolase